MYSYELVTASQWRAQYSIVGRSEEADSIVPQYSILDEDGDEIAVVFSEGEAEALVSHLNR